MHTKTAASLQVAIVSTNPETLDGLEAYLCSVGVRAKGHRHVEDCVRLSASSALAIVLFPDDFSPSAALATVAELAATVSSTLRVLVTSHPKTYERLVEGCPNVLVVPRPVWGWTILDAIRAHCEQLGIAGKYQLT